MFMCLNDTIAVVGLPDAAINRFLHLGRNPQSGITKTIQWSIVNLDLFDALPFTNNVIYDKLGVEEWTMRIEHVGEVVSCRIIVHYTDS